MLLFFKSFIVGIGKIIPGVSGALLAINFNIYDKLLDAVTHFFDDWKYNLRFLLIFFNGVLFAIILCSNIILFLINNYYFLVMMFFTGLIFGGTYNFAKKINYSYINIIVIVLIIIFLLLITLYNGKYNYIVSNTVTGNIVLFFGGFIDMFTSVVPGISGTSLLMIIGIYDDILRLISSMLDYSYVINNIGLYFSYGLGMAISFIINAYLINYILSKHKNMGYTAILGLSIASIIILLLMIFRVKFSFLELIFGVILLTVGMLLSSILDK